jgi:hypothetical protein
MFAENATAIQSFHRANRDRTKVKELLELAVDLFLFIELG